MQNKIRYDFLHNLRRPAADGQAPVITAEPFNQIIARISVYRQALSTMNRN
ncbi:hypothetical protein SMITH_408 [Smithella sp. ME-1]|uniref:Uncharacterized protein n=1 Tax=hydrocarbon metagenome TaxID=938273 RepID=A0A0W8FMY5_9ZZZZ|nr:hypothetical protein SMITH_408 [Smithella sp. ME-1]